MNLRIRIDFTATFHISESFGTGGRSSVILLGAPHIRGFFVLKSPHLHKYLNALAVFANLVGLTNLQNNTAFILPNFSPDLPDTKIIITHNGSERAQPQVGGYRG